MHMLDIDNFICEECGAEAISEPVSMKYLDFLDSKGEMQ